MKIIVHLTLLSTVSILIFLWNHELFLWINGWHSPLTDQIMGMVTGLGDSLIAVLLLAMLMLFHLRLGLAALLALALSGAITQIIKRTLEVPRPPAVFEHVHLLGESFYNYSFPSGHATTCGVMAMLSLYLWQTQFKAVWLLFTLFLLAAYGRIYGGVHFPLDMFVGFSIGILSMWWCEKKSQAWQVSAWLHSEWSWKLPGMLLMAAAVWLGTGYQVQPTTAQAFALFLPITALFTLIFAWKKKLR